MPARLIAIPFLLLVLIGVGSAGSAPPDDDVFRVLVFSKTAGFRHASIPDGIAALRKLGAEHGFEVDATEDTAAFTDDSLEQYAVVVFLSTTGDILDDEQQEAFQGFIRAGGGYVGIHAAADTEYDWPWYGRLCGGYFKSHPHIQDATIIVEDRTHPSTQHLPERWQRRDEWYDYRGTARGRDRIRVLMSLDETTYDGGGMPDDHPIAWCHEFDGGRAFYTGGGHTSESFTEKAFMRHVLGGITWAAGRDVSPGAPTGEAPEG